MRTKISYIDNRGRDLIAPLARNVRRLEGVSQICIFFCNSQYLVDRH